jgi:hypothetical protein
MPRTPEHRPQCACPQQRAARAQAAIRALLARRRRAPLTAAERLELAEWQREWVAAWREGQYVTAA